jgi:hypothetical protein
MLPTKINGSVFVIVAMAGLLSPQLLCAQNVLSQSTHVEVGIGYASPFLQSGKELLRAQDFREKEQSYYQDSEGNRKNVGKYSTLNGYSLSIGFYKPLKKTNGLMLGAMVRNTQTGSTPADGYSEAFFFNFITAGIALKFYPLSRTNLFTKIDFGLASVLTKNRFINEANEQNFFHQFGIGSGGSLAVGYSIQAFRNKSEAIDVQLTYQQLSTRVEVNGIGDDQWKFGALNFTVAMNF